jgi:hypothetical protein
MSSLIGCDDKTYCKCSAVCDDFVISMAQTRILSLSVVPSGRNMLFASKHLLGAVREVGNWKFVHFFLPAASRSMPVRVAPAFDIVDAVRGCEISSSDTI